MNVVPSESVQDTWSYLVSDKLVTTSSHWPMLGLHTSQLPFAAGSMPPQARPPLIVCEYLGLVMGGREQLTPSSTLQVSTVFGLLHPPVMNRAKISVCLF